MLVHLHLQATECTPSAVRMCTVCCQLHIVRAVDVWQFVLVLVMQVWFHDGNILLWLLRHVCYWGMLFICMRRLPVLTESRWPL